MKFLVVFACALAAASAGYISAPLAHAHVYAAGYHGAQHLPLINHEGVPVDTADVQVAKAAHLSHKVNVAARNGDLALGHHVVAPVVAHSAYVAPYHGVAAYSAPIYHGAVAHAHYLRKRGIYAPVQYQHVPLINHEGVPVDTADVQVARAEHLAHKVNVAHRNGDHAIVAHAAPVVSTYAHSPIVAHAAPVVAAHTTYAHAAPVVAHHAHAYAAPWAHYY